MSSKTIFARHGPLLAPISTTVSPFFVPPAPVSAPVCSGDVAEAVGDVLEDAVNALLEREALAGAGLLRLGERRVTSLPLEQHGELLLEAGDLLLAPVRLLLVALDQGASQVLAGLLQLGHLALVALVGFAACVLLPDLHRDQRVARILGRQHLGQLGLLELDRGLQHGLDLTLDRVGALVVEVLGDPLRDLLAAVLELLLHLRAEPAHALLELVLHVIDVRRRALRVDYAGADLDRLRDRLDGGNAGLVALAYHLGRALVGDRQRLDDDAVVDRSHRGVLLLGVEGQLVEVRTRGFHGGSRR